MKTQWVSCPATSRAEAIRWETVLSEVDDETDGTLVAQDSNGMTKWSPVEYGSFKELANAEPSEFETAFNTVTSEADDSVSFDVGAASNSLYDAADEDEEEELGPFERLLRGEDVPEEELPMDSLTSDEPVMDKEELKKHKTTADLEEEEDEEDGGDFFEV